MVQKGKGGAGKESGVRGEWWCGGESMRRERVVREEKVMKEGKGGRGGWGLWEGVGKLKYSAGWKGGGGSMVGERKRGRGRTGGRGMEGRERGREGREEKGRAGGGRKGRE